MSIIGNQFFKNLKYIYLFIFPLQLFSQITKIDSVKHVLKEIEIVAPNKSEDDIGNTLNFIAVNSDYLTKFQGNTLINTLEKLPGISSINVGAGISKPVIRGLSLNRVIVNEYGIKQEGQQWASDHGLEIDQFNVDKVEIVKGPVSVIYGSDGLGGVINIYPAYIPKTDSFNGEFVTNYKSNNDLYGASLKLQANKNDVFTIVRFTFQDYGSYRVPADNFTYNGYVLPIYNNRLKNTAGKEINYSILTGVKRKWGFTRVYISNYNQQAGFFVGAIGVPRAYQLKDDGKPRKIDIPNQRINHFKIISNTMINVKKGYFEIDLGYQFNQRNEFSFPHAHGVGNNIFGNLALGLNLQTYTANIKFTHQISNTFKNIYGIAFQHQINTKTGHEFLIPDYNQSQGGVFIFSEYKVNTNFLISSGIRVDAAHQKANKYFMPKYNNALQYIGDVQVSPELNNRYTNFSGSIGSAYTFLHKWKLKSNIGTAYRIPVIAELAANGVHHGTFRHEKGDSSLTAERGYMLDLGLYRSTEKFNFEVTPFANYFTNYIYLSPSAKFSPLPDAGQIYLYKETKALFWGFESTAKYRFNNFITNETSIEYVWNVNRKDSLPLPFTPPLSFLNEIVLTPFNNKKKMKQFHFTLTAQYFAAQNRVDRNEPKTPDYFLIHASISNDFTIGKQKISFHFQVRNLTNTRYLNNMSRYRILNLPEQGRNIQVILKYKF